MLKLISFLTLYQLAIFQLFNASTPVDINRFCYERIEKTPITTLSQIKEGEWKGELKAVPKGYKLQKQGIWSYKEAYLFYNTDGERFEIYVFASDDKLNSAQESCDKEYFNNGEGRMCCSGDGKSCSVTLTADGGVNIATCK